MKAKLDKNKDIQKIEEILAKVRPYIRMHGGDVDFISHKDGVVTLNISGTCSHCSLADMTYNMLIAGIMKEEIPGFKEVFIKK
ncbi:MAG: NifU family protein [Candidatus Paceibacterota bacterium]|jgi:Fe-S cluster biogenesis protein NfuA